MRTRAWFILTLVVGDVLLVAHDLIAVSGTIVA